MRTIVFISTLALALAFALSCNSKAESKLNGDWVPVKQEINGSPLPQSVFQTEKLAINDSNYTVTAESVDKGSVRYSGDNKMDIYGKEGVNAGKHFTAIYKLENGQLTICYDLSGNGYPEAFDTKGKPMYFLSVYGKDGQKVK